MGKPGNLYMRLGSYDLATAVYQEVYQVAAQRGDPQAASHLAVAALEYPAATDKSKRRAKRLMKRN